MSQAKKKPQATAALAEGNGKPRTITVRGESFELPADVPFAVLFATRTAHTAQAEQDNAAASVAMLELAEAYVGADRLRQLVNGLSLQEGTEAIKELIDACHAEYGTDTGESSASSGS